MKRVLASVLGALALVIGLAAAMTLPVDAASLRATNLGGDVLQVKVSGVNPGDIVAVYAVSPDNTVIYQMAAKNANNSGQVTSTQRLPVNGKHGAWRVVVLTPAGEMQTSVNL